MKNFFRISAPKQKKNSNWDLDKKNLKSVPT